MPNIDNEDEVFCVMMLLKHSGISVVESRQEGRPDSYVVLADEKFLGYE